MDTTPHDVITFWHEAGPGRWFRKDDAFDADFRARFEPVHEAAAAGRLGAWADTADGTLALLVLLDQFPRNAYRGSQRMFATDEAAVRLAEAGIARGFDCQVAPALRRFFYMPFMHSERMADQQRCVQLCEPLADDTLRFAREHLEIIERFGRFPHRNPLLGRLTTPEERQFLDAGGFAG